MDGCVRCKVPLLHSHREEDEELGDKLIRRVVDRHECPVCSASITTVFPVIFLKLEEGGYR